MTLDGGPVDDRDLPRPLRYLAAHVPILIGLPLGVVLSSLTVLGVAASIARQRGYSPEASLYDLLPLVLPLESPLRIALATLGNQLAFVFLLGLWTLRRRAKATEDLSIERTTFSAVVLVSAGMYALSISLNEVVSLCGWDQAGNLGEIRRALESLSLSQRALMLPVTALLAGTVEELFFRGLFMSRLRSVGGPRLAIVLSALWFGIAHFDPIHSVAAGLMGLFLGWALIRGGSLIPLICAHILNNLLATLFPASFGQTVASQVLSLVTALLVFVAVLFALGRHWTEVDAQPGAP